MPLVQVNKGAAFGAIVLLILSAATLFLSAFLLFICQPMVGKMLLPYLGGAAAVWTTCVLFFQFMLLLGYMYAHLLARITDIRKQMAAHAALLVLPLAFMPIRFSVASPESFSLHPLTQLLTVLVACTAVPFFVVSSTAPLLQNWLSRTTHAASSDPYFLYSASNAGSLLALMAYPFVIEPRIGVVDQGRLWFAGYVALTVAFGLTAAALYVRRIPNDQKQPIQSGMETGRRLFWVVAAFVPSGLMLAVTTHIAANIGSVPFLWLVPLAIYLLTFIMAFSRRFSASAERVSRLLPVVVLAVFPLVAASVAAPPGLNWLVIGAHLLLLSIGALLCHTRLAESRPKPQHLTEFYFWIALGGVLGGVFTATIAPVLFKTVLEYPLLVATLPFFRVGKAERTSFVPPALIAVAILCVWSIFYFTHLASDTEVVALVHTALLFAGFKLRNHTQQFAWSFVVLILGYSLILPGYIEGANRLYISRNFFGVKKVLEDPDAHLRKLLHGDTIHGIESTEPGRVGQPLSYYYPGGAVSDVIEMLRDRGKTQRFAVVGLGAGTMASYADKTHHMTFYEIDPSVEPIARRYFTFLPSCGLNCDVIIGDGRLRLAQAPDGAFDMLLLDAFSSDSVPAHLFSREALQMYLSKLTPDGVLLFHVSNRYLNVEGLVSALVADAGLASYSRFDEAGELRNIGKSSANHVVAARRMEDLQALAGRPGWRWVTRPPGFQTWTDDYSNLLSLIRWH